MSNLIKYQFVNLDGKDAVLIDNNPEKSGFTPLRERNMKIQTISEIEAQKALRQAQEMAEAGAAGEGFQAGVPVTNFDKLFQEHQKKAESRAGEVVEEAKKEAEQIRAEAHIAADAARASGYEEGKQQGYQDGLRAAEQELQQREAELAELARQQKEELAECISAIEVKYVDVLIRLLRKLTGVVLEDKEDLLLYLIRTTASELEPSQNYNIRISPDDIYFLETKREEILDALGEEVNLEFIEEKGLEKGQCIIETDTQMVDCSFQTQLDTLIRDLRMLTR
nr:hypothetical protein [Eubacterium sp.]